MPSVQLNKAKERSNETLRYVRTMHDIKLR